MLRLGVRRSFFVLVLTWIGLGLLGESLFAAPLERRTSAKTSFVQLFEWKWMDVARECEVFLGPKGFDAVQVSPPNEHAVLPNYPWYQRYQPVSYQLTSRSGTRDEFIDMVRRCRAAGVDIYVDAILNHMSWVNRSGATKYGTAGTRYDEYSYGELFSPADFHRCGKNGDDQIANYQDRWEVQNCNLATCADLKTESPYVRDILVNYLNDLLEIGVAGFRIDAAKHIPASDIQAIFSRLNRPFYNYQEVIDFGGEPIRSEEYFQSGDVSEFRYARNLAQVFNRGRLAWLEHFGSAWGFLPASRAVVFVDNHDIQRGHGGGGEALTHKDGQKYALASVFVLAWPYGTPLVMSSYRFSDPSAGPPSNEKGETKSVFQNGYSTCGQDWICEHRWMPIANMIGFRSFTRGAPVTKWWSNGGNTIAFARGTEGFLVLNAEPTPVQRWFDTGLAPGQYCDVISGQLTTGGATCSGATITVNQYGWAEISANPSTAVAIHGGSRITF